MRATHHTPSHPASTALRFLSCLLLAAGAHAAQPNLSSGEWEYEMQVSMPGVNFAMPPMRFRSCVDRNNPAPQDPGQQRQGKKSSNECKVLEQRFQGNTVTWHVRCEGRDGVSDTRGEGTYQGTSFKGRLTTTTAGQRNRDMTAQMSGRRVGPCTQPR
ncbi:MAG: DUF3617 domain-containing protein [Hylemonella sp.]|nr:DUF3617 domain-containing protein [Hylemonella sp.]